MKVLPMRILALLPAFAVTTLLSIMPATAQEQAPPKWRGHIEAEGKWGTERSLGEIGTFLPVWQNDTTLVFGDVRGRFDDRSSSEGNFGIGIRHQVNNQWALGGYAFYDRRHTAAGNNFDQGTFGVEALGERFELRMNTYLPEGDAKTIAGTGGAATSTAATGGGNFQMTTVTTGATVERALPGVDFEAGYQFDIPGDWEFWAYGGGFHFDADGYDNVSGPRGRLELSYNNVPYLGDGSRFTVGFESQTDSVRGGQSWGIARLRIPLNYNGARDTARLSTLDQRMTTRIVRDIDVVAGEAVTPSTTVTESASVTLANGRSYDSYLVADGPNELNTQAFAGGAGSLIVASGTFSDLGFVIVNPNQAVIGGGQAVTLTGDNTGRTVSTTLPGTRPNITFTAPGNNGIIVQENGLVENINIIDAGQRGIVTTGGNNQIIRNVTINNTGNDNILIADADNVRISNVTLSNPDGGGEENIQIQIGADNLIIENTVMNGGNYGVIFVAGATYNNPTFTNVTVDNAGNVMEAQNGATVNGMSGNITVNAGGTACVETGTGDFAGSTLTVNGNPCPP